MKTIIENARKALADAEVQLRELIGDAARAADYDGVRRLSLAAERLVGLCEELDGAPSTNAQDVQAVPAKARAVSARQSKDHYPRFQRRNGALWRVGWSKKAREEYVHKVPRESYDLIVGTLAAVGRNGASLITVEQIIKHLRDVERTEVPVYQVYVALGLLGREGHVEKHGRDGYRVPTPPTLAGQARETWEALPEGC